MKGKLEDIIALAINDGFAMYQVIDGEIADVYKRTDVLLPPDDDENGMDSDSENC